MQTPTMQAELYHLLAYLWAAFGVYWIGTAVLKRSASKRAESTQSRESRFYRPLRLLILALTFSLLFWQGIATGFLGARFVPFSSTVSAAGFAAALIGLAVALWARVRLGEYWSDKVVLQEGHRLIRSGPYAYMRHPIYSGVLLGVGGTALVLGEVRGIVAFVMLLVNYSIKAKREENILEHDFGEEFKLHREQTGFLFPKVH
ncbi:MAG TPA: isoprenylcysteine carboxylmethyltransferase family protein [Terriglobales bacterium]